MGIELQGAVKRSVADLMSAPVISVAPGAAFKEIGSLLAQRRISAVPVVDGGRLVGIVSERDLLPKEGIRDRHGRLALWLHHGEEVKAEALVAAQLMSTPVVTVEAHASLARAARLMLEHRVKQLPVVDPDGGLVGILSRRDVLRVFTTSDDEIRRQVTDDIIRRRFWMDPALVAVDVRDGIVTLEGTLPTRSDTGMLVRAVEALDCVVAVVDHVGYEFDDQRALPPAEARVR